MVAVIRVGGLLCLRPAQISEYMLFWTTGDPVSAKTNKQKTLKEFIVDVHLNSLSGGRKGVLFYKW